MHKETWSLFGNRLDVNDIVDVAVEKLWKEDLYRWPIQLRAIRPDIQKYMFTSTGIHIDMLILRIPADSWDPPIDMRGKSVQEIEKYTDRRIPTENWFLHENMEEAANPYHNMAV